MKTREVVAEIGPVRQLPVISREPIIQIFGSRIELNVSRIRFVIGSSFGWSAE